MLSLTKITRSEMGAYLCIASNSVPPSVSKRMKVQVHCKSFVFLFINLSNCFPSIVVAKIFLLIHPFIYHKHVGYTGRGKKGHKNNGKVIIYPIVVLKTMPQVLVEFKQKVWLYCCLLYGN